MTLLLALLVSQAVQAASVSHNNLADLMNHSEAIVVGQVQDLRDGFDSNRVPYTEVTLKVAEQIRGRQSGDAEFFVFRQFGLLEPRTMADGRVNMNITPDGWSRYGLGEEVVLFLSHPARHTGLRTTVGLQQGKVTIRNGKIRTQGSNAGLFQNMGFGRGVLNTEELNWVSEANQGKPVNSQDFIKLVRKAHKEDWAGKGRMKHEG